MWSYETREGPRFMGARALASKIEALILDAIDDSSA